MVGSLRHGEPRVHVLFYSLVHEENKNEAGVVYCYHGVSMKAQALSKLPNVKDLSSVLERNMGLPCWNVGVDVIVYRNGNDRIGWNVDDSQSEKNSFLLCWRHIFTGT